MSKEAGTQGVTAIALLIGGRLTVLMANAYLKLVKPKIATKVFMTKEQAMKWLNEFISNSSRK